MRSWTADMLYALIAARYPEPAWACFPQVADGTGGHKRRSADAVAMSLWPSRGLGLYGFEIKVSRSDWRRELKDPSKAESIASKCVEWWIVAPRGIVPVDELPPTWGLLCPSTDDLRSSTVLEVVRRAAAREAFEPDRPFWAALLRAAQKAQETLLAQAVPRADLERQVEEGIAKRRAQIEGAAEAKVHEELRRLGRLEASVKRFEEASGVQIDAFNGRQMGAAVALALKYGGSAERLRAGLLQDVSRTRKLAGDLLSDLDDVGRS